MIERQAQRVVACLALWATLLGAACTRQGLVEYAMTSAPHLIAGKPVDAGSRPEPRYQLLAGDLHCHVSPPDAPSDVTRSLLETAELARTERLDFVVLTPHIKPRFFETDAGRAVASRAQATLRDAIAHTPSAAIFIPGFEYTDPHFGHAGLSFGDVDGVLAKLSVSEARRHPERFFELFVASGGVLTLNHPLVTPLASIFQMARADMSWRPLTSTGPIPDEITAVDRLAQGYEAYNLMVSHVRDRYLQFDSDKTLRETLARFDGEVIRRRRRMSPFGGSDSHGHFLRATTFVLSESRTAAGVREALIAGRVCVQSPEACSFEARIPGGEWRTVGAAFEGIAALEVRAHGASIEVYRDGEIAASPLDGSAATIAVPRDRCAVLRARVGESFSAPIYANCPFADASP